ncbi:MAG: S26 family signal peptidase [Lachnospiraceae bacterium]|nr:S26 family signal peptidase [Lachnospiraceae bacterium]
MQRQDIEKLLQEGKNIQIKPQGYSMYPVLVPGRDEAIIEPVGAKKLRRGDVVLYRRAPEVSGGILVLHRIWKCKNDGYYMVGDNQTEIEGPLREEQIKGIMVGMLRKGKYISVQNPLYRVATGGWLFLRPLRPKIAKVAAAIKKWMKL